MPDSWRPRLGFAITSQPRPHLDRLAARVEALGYDELWSNDTHEGSGLATLAGCAGATRRIALGVGVIGLSERDPGPIVEEIRRLRLPLDRLVVGLGSGRSRSLEVVRDGVIGLRELLPGTPIAMAAIGPRMCRLAGEIGDVVLLNWATADRIVWSRDRVGEGAAAAGRPTPVLAAYVRVAIGPRARRRLAEETARYGASPAYRRAFADQGADGRGIGIACRSAKNVAEALGPYRDVLDTTIVRGLPASDGADAWLEIAEAAAPGR